MHPIATADAADMHRTATTDANGNFSFSNAIDPSVPQRFFLMQVP